MDIRQSTGYNKDFDLEVHLPDWTRDRKAGESAESWVAYLIANLDSGKFEVKLDRKWEGSGFIYLEYASWSLSKQCFVPSGIQTSKASMWAFVLPLRGENITVFISAQILRDAYEFFKGTGNDKPGGESGDCPTRGILVPHDLQFRRIPSTALPEAS